MQGLNFQLQNFVVMWSETIEKGKFSTQRVVIRTLTAINMLLHIKWNNQVGDECELIFWGGVGLWEPLKNRSVEGVKNPKFLQTLFMNDPLD